MSDHTAVIRRETIHTQLLINKEAEQCKVVFSRLVSVGWEEVERRRYLQLGFLDNLVWFAYPMTSGVRLEDFLRGRDGSDSLSLIEMGLRFKLEAAKLYFGNDSLSYGPYARATQPGQRSNVATYGQTALAPLSDMLGTEWRLPEEKGPSWQGLVRGGSFSNT